jgi:hypothetical protein
VIKWELNPQIKKKNNHLWSITMEDIKHEMNVVIQELEKQGINPNSHTDPNMTGLGDVVENVLNTFGITQERFKTWFNLKECNCTKRKAYLNNLFSWKNNNT